MLALKKRFLQRARTQVEEYLKEEALQNEPPEPEATPAGPPLVLLVPTGSVLSFRLHTFSDAASAAEFLQALYLDSVRLPGLKDGIIAFWALQRRPLEGCPTEAVALIRDPLRPEVVHLWSFLEMSSAQAFLARQAQEGASLDQMLAYWAVPVDMETDDSGSLCLILDPPPTAVPAPPAETPAPIEEASPAAGKAARGPDSSPALGVASGPLADGEATAWNLKVLALPSGRALPALEAPAASPQAPHPSTDEKPPAVHEETPTREADPTAPAGDARNHPHQAGEEITAPDAEDIVEQVRRVLRIKRWERRDEPFRGFHSAPGRF